MESEDGAIDANLKSLPTGKLVEAEIPGIDDIRGTCSEWFGPPKRPQDVAYMSAHGASREIASKGAVEDFDVGNEVTWTSAFDALFDKVCRDDLEVWGRRSEGGFLEKIPGHKFLGLKFEHPCEHPSNDSAASVFDDRPTLKFCPGDCDGDKLYSGNRQLEYLDVCFKGRDLARHWPFGAAHGSRGGRKETYDAERLRKDIEAQLVSKGPFRSPEAFVKWCCDHTHRKDGASRPKNIHGEPSDVPDQHTIKALIKRHQLDQIEGCITKR